MRHTSLLSPMFRKATEIEKRLVQLETEDRSRSLTVRQVEVGVTGEVDAAESVFTKESVFTAVC